MRIFQSTYKDREGRTCTTKRWYIEFSYKRERPHRLPGLTDRQQTEGLARRIGDLINHKEAGETFPPALTKWIEGLSPRLRDALAAIGLLDAGKVAALRPLAEHLDGAADAPGWRQYLSAKGNTPGHVDKQCARAGKIIEGCRFAYWSEVSASKVMAYLDELRANTTDKAGNVATWELPVENNPPSAPAVISPTTDRFGVFGGQPVTFTWMAAKDDSGAVLYTVEV
ncbi:MAG: hypothetical protein WCK05_15555, partial [Planctomycetota bacterium]